MAGHDKNEAMLLAIFRQIGDAGCDRCAGAGDGQWLAALDEGSRVQGIGPAHGAHDLGAAGADQTRYTQYLPRADVEAYVLEHALARQILCGAYDLAGLDAAC